MDPRIEFLNFLVQSGLIQALSPPVIQQLNNTVMSILTSLDDEAQAQSQQVAMMVQQMLMEAQGGMDPNMQGMQGMPPQGMQGMPPQGQQMPTQQDLMPGGQQFGMDPRSIVQQG